MSAGTASSGSRLAGETIATLSTAVWNVRYTSENSSVNLCKALGHIAQDFVNALLLWDLRDTDGDTLKVFGPIFMQTNTFTDQLNVFFLYCWFLSAGIVAVRLAKPNHLA